MQGGKELSASARGVLIDAWTAEAWKATLTAKSLSKMGLHKSLVNRLMEPFMWHTVVVTATAWENFFALRLDADAQPEIRVAAEAMKAAYDASEPVPLFEGQWHLPYVSAEDGHIIQANVGRDPISYEEALARTTDKVRRISAARCARVSYLTHDGQRDMNADLTLYDRLITDRVDAGLPVHWSPLEHVATPWAANRQEWSIDFTSLDGTHHGVSTDHLPVTGNLLGWRSLRTEVETIHKERTYR
jgi:hypothetical protein